MKTIFKIILKLALACLVIVLLFNYLSHVFFNREVNHGDQFRALKEDSLDVLVLGSSHAQYSFSPALYYEKTGLYSYVLGSPCQPLKVSLEFLKECYKNQSPKLVILEVFTALDLSETCAGNVSCVVPQYQMTGQERIDVINMLPEDIREDYYNDFISAHNDWKTMENLDAFKFSNAFNTEHKIDESFGYVYQQAPIPTDSYWLAVDYPGVEAKGLKEDVKETLNEIYDLAKSHGSTLYLYKTPIDSFKEYDQAQLNDVWKWAKEKDIAYRDFFDLDDFYMYIHSDSFHCYVNGAAYLTSELAKTTKDITSYNHHEDNALSALYTKRAQAIVREVIKSEADPYKVMPYIFNSKGDYDLYIPENIYNQDFLKYLEDELDTTLDYGSWYHYENGKLISKEPRAKSLEKYDEECVSFIYYFGEDTFPYMIEDGSTVWKRHYHHYSPY